MTVELHAYQYSVYSWIARLVLREKEVGYDYVEVNPFAADMPIDYLTKHPFRRVPTLVHDGFVLYETAAITRYVDETFSGTSLQPADNRSQARLTQIIGIIDAYGYWPMVRQVFSHRVFRPRTGQVVDESEIRSGIVASERVLVALEALAEDGDFLIANQLTIADLHLAPMMAYFSAAAEGSAVLARHPRLSAWWDLMRMRTAFVATDPGLPGGTLDLTHHATTVGMGEGANG
jgi:glutathione S-transferase